MAPGAEEALMPLPLSDPGTGALDVKTRLFSAQLDVIAAALAGTDVVLRGCFPTPGGGLNVAIAEGAVLSAGGLSAVAAGSIAVGAADANFRRIDLVVWSLSGSLAVRAGTPSVTPVPPMRTANDVVLAMVFVAAGQSTLLAGDVLDHRALREWGPVTLKRTSQAVTVANTNLATAVASISVPPLLLTSGRQLRLEAGGNYRSNSGTPTWTWTLSVGGVVAWRDTTAATASSANRGAWTLRCTLAAITNATQSLVGHLAFQTPGAKTAPNTGTAGDLAVTTNINAPLRAAPAVNFGAGSVAVELLVTMSVANAAVETVCDFSNFELVF